MQRDIAHHDVERARGELLQLAHLAFEASRLTTSARDAAEVVDVLPGLVRDLDAPDSGGDLVRMRQGAAAVNRMAQRLAELAAEARDLLRDSLRDHAAGAPPERHRRTARRLRRAAERAARTHEALRGRVTTLAREAAGYAAVHEPAEGPEPLWDLAQHLLACVPPTGVDPVAARLAGGPGDQRVVAGVVAHAALHRPSWCSFTTETGTGVRVTLPEGGGAAVVRGDDVWVDDECSAITRVAEVVLEQLSGGGAGAGDTLLVAAGVAAGHPDAVPAEGEPGVLELEHPTVHGLAVALAERLQEWIDTIGVDALWATVAQPGTSAFAHLGSNGDGALFTEVAGNFSLDEVDELDDEDVARLSALGWGDPVDEPSDDEEIQPRNHTRVWPAPFDLDAACWVVALTLVAVHGFDLRQPVELVVEPFR